MRIVVLVKPVPDATGQERLRPDGRLDRSAAPPVLNGNDEYTLEAALRLVDAHGGDVTLVAMAPAEARDALRKGLAMGAARAVLVTDDLLAGSCALSTMQVLAAALRTIEFDLVLAGADSADGGGGVVGAGIATLLDLPLVSGAAAIDAAGEGVIHVRRIVGTGEETVEATAAGARRRHAAARRAALPDAQGDHGRAGEGDRRAHPGGPRPGRRAAVGGGSATTVVVAQRPPVARAAGRVSSGRRPTLAAREIVDFLVERRAVR